MTEACAALKSIIINDELASRPARNPNFAAECDALRKLALALASSPETILQKLVDLARDVTQAESAGISIAETSEGEAIFRWHAISGKLSGFVHGTMPRNFSPCGEVVDQKRPLLMRQPIRLYKYVDVLGMHLEEVLLVPFFRNDMPIGTIWAVAHGQDKKFDSEDLRILGALAEFASAAIQTHQRTVELKEEKLAREKFVNAVTHDLLTPLTAAKMSAYVLSKRTNGDSANQRFVGRIISGLERADRMIRDLLDANLIKAGEGIPLTKAHCDLHEIATEVLNLLMPVHGPRFVIRTQSAAVEGNWDRNAISRVIENLVGNAVKYGHESTPIIVAVDADANWAEIKVHNRGPVISEAELPILFEPYRRAESAVRAGKPGWGIGLTLVKGIVEAHGGSVKVESQPSDGTTFTVRLPRDSVELKAGAEN